MKDFFVTRPTQIISHHELKLHISIDVSTISDDIYSSISSVGKILSASFSQYPDVIAGFKSIKQSVLHDKLKGTSYGFSRDREVKRQFASEDHYMSVVRNLDNHCFQEGQFTIYIKEGVDATALARFVIELNNNLHKLNLMPVSIDDLPDCYISIPEQEFIQARVAIFSGDYVPISKVTDEKLDIQCNNQLLKDLIEQVVNYDVKDNEQVKVINRPSSSQSIQLYSLAMDLSAMSAGLIGPICLLAGLLVVASLPITGIGLMVGGAISIGLGVAGCSFFNNSAQVDNFDQTPNYEAITGSSS